MSWISAAILALLLMSIVNCQISLVEAEAATSMDSSRTLECHRRLYSYKVTQTDENGKMCWDIIQVWACWGRCDSNEISDWRFPYKKSSHPVCVHYGRNKAVANLRNCEDGALPSAAKYEYMEAGGCRCQLCYTADTSCEGLLYMTHRSHRSHRNLQTFEHQQQ